ncbi:MAG: effector-associated domain EAD1-containing protein, partial [Chitinophagaceae bacterium]
MDDIQEIELTIEQRQELESAFLNAFNHDDLARMLRLKMGIKIGEELNFARGLKLVVTDLIDIAISGGWLVRLILAAREYKPGNIYLRRVTEKLNISQPEAISKENISLATDIHGNDRLLEKIVRKRAPFIPFNKYTEQLLSMGGQIARVEIPEGTEAGTGWLVGPNLLLTAYHVIESIDKKENGLDFNDLSFRFDYTTESGVPRTCSVKKDWLIDHAPYSEHDLKSSSKEPAPAELDYA